MKLIVLLMALAPAIGFGQSVEVGISINPAGSFKVKSLEVTGFATQSGGAVEAKNVVVGLRNVQTGISLRDKHTKQHLETDKFPQAILVVAKGKGGKGSGILKIRGIEKKVSGTYKIDSGKLVASFPIKLSDYNVRNIKYMGVGVNDEANVTVSVPIRKTVAMARTSARSPASKKPRH